MRYVVFYQIPGWPRWRTVARFRFHGDAAEYVSMLQSKPYSRLRYQIRNLDT